MATLNLSIVNVSLPTIRVDFAAGVPESQFVVVSYVAVVTALLIPLGRLSDVYGRRRNYLLGFAIFALGAAACGLAGSIWQIVGFRAFQAVGAAMLIAAGPAVITESFPVGRGKALGIIGVVVAAGLTTGNVLGGVIDEFVGWRWVFLLNVPVGAAGILLARSAIAPGASGRSADLPGCILLAATVLLLVGAVSIASARLPLAAATVVLLAAFVLRERRARAPILPAGLRDRFLAAGLASVSLAFLGYAAASFLVPFYLTDVLGASPTERGLVLVANPIAFSIVGPLAGSLHDRRGWNFLAPLGLAVAAAGFLLLSNLGPGASLLMVAAELALVGVGIGLFSAPNNSALLGAVARDSLGALSGVIATMRNLGMALGTAVSAQIFFLLAPAGFDSEPLAFVSAMHAVFVVAAVLLAAGAAASLSRPRPAKGGAPATASEPPAGESLSAGTRAGP